jgi:Lanthionine synthetase C-like protein
MVSAATRPLLTGDDAARALETAERVFARSLRAIEAGARAPESPGGFGGCLLAGDALLRAGREIPRSLREIAQAALVTSPERRSLYDGRAGLLAILDAVDRDGGAFARPRAALRAAIAAELRAAPALDPADRYGYDLVAGVAGKLIALRDVPEDVARHVCALFRDFADRVEERIGGAGDPADAPLDIGVAHGVPGILAALNVALPCESGLARRYAGLIVALSHEVGGARRWDAVWSRERVPPPRRAWCYQTAGVAAVLHDRALLDGDAALRALARDALLGTLREPEQPHWDDALCHGRSGVALIHARVAGDDERFARAAELLARRVLDDYRDDAPFGYRAYDLIAQAEDDRPEFLDGALGVALFLVEAAAPSDLRWLPLLGLRPGACA